MNHTSTFWDSRVSLYGILVLTTALFPGIAMGEPTSITSGKNQKTFTIEVREGTAGTPDQDYILGEYFGGGSGLLRHGFSDQYQYRDEFCPETDPRCFVSMPSDLSELGALEATDHNWLECAKTPVIVDLGTAHDSARVIVFSSIDHFGIQGKTFDDPSTQKWNVVIEAVEFTVYGSDSFPDALEASRTEGVFGNRETESGTVPSEGAGSTFEQGELELMFEDGWKDFEADQEGDDFASVWKFSKPYRFIAVHSNYTDPFVEDGFQSEDCEVDAVGAYLGT